MILFEMLIKKTHYNTDGLINCLRQPGQLDNQPLKSMPITSFHFLNLYTVTNPAAETKSIGLPADAQVVMVFASPSGQFHHSVTNPYCLSGLGHLDNFLVTRNLSPSIGTMQKLVPTNV